jgi:hypothetical protein
MDYFEHERNEAGKCPEIRFKSSVSRAIQCFVLESEIIPVLLAPWPRKIHLEKL